MIERLFGRPEAMAAALAAEIGERLSDAVVERGRAAMVVTGGSTPGPVYDALSKIDLPWKAVWITLSDERWLPPDHPDSNERLVRDRLLRGKATAAHLAPLKTDEATPAEACEAIDARVAALPRPFDVVLLGMGSDGHIASLFPGDAALDPVKAASVVAVNRPGAAGSAQRLSLSLSALTDTRWIALVLRGADKLERLRAPAGTPVAALLAQDLAPVEAFWSP